MDSGTRLGPYEIVERLGAGGMGEVFLAQDTRLGRSVAIKVLPAQFAAEPDRLARFEQEARAAAALNHPGIAAIYDVGVEGDGGERTHYMVQEFLEGETLEDFMVRGPAARNKALTLCAEIAEALAVAHQAGIVHRDLKPANVFVTPEGRAKVLDFGLAKLTEMSTVAGGGDASMSPTVVGTMAGTIMGTAGYMAPEQVHGETIDRRADIFALGCVLYQLLTGQRAFAGKSLPDTLARILHEDPDPIDGLSPQLARLVDKCLAKDRGDRYQHADDLAVDLRYLDSHDGPVPDAEAVATSAKRLGLAAVAGIAAVSLALGAAGSLMWGGSGAGSGTGGAVPVPTQLTRFATDASSPAISPNGQMVAFVATDPLDGWSQVFVKTLPDGPPLRLTSTQDHKSEPQFSPDGSQVSYTVLGEEWKWDTWSVPITGGAPRVMLRNANALSWTPDGRILFSKFKVGAHLGIVLADASGGNQEEIWFPPLPYQMAHASEISPDGTRIAIGYMGATDGGGLRCFVSGLDVSPGEPERLDVGPDAPPCRMDAHWSADGRWLYYESGRGSEVWRLPMAGGAAERIVPTYPGIEGIDGFVLTPDGRSLIYSAGATRRSVWMRTMTGLEHQLTFEQDASDARFSPDGRSILYRQAGRRRAGAIWRYDLADGTRESLCPGLPAFGFAVARDAQRLLVLAADDDDGDGSVWLCFPDGSEPPRAITSDASVSAAPAVFSHDGETIYFAAPTTTGIELLSLAVESGERQLLHSLDVFGFPIALSPDGEWLAISVRESSRETWLVPVGGGEPRLAVRGWDLEWSPDGSSFMFLNDGMVSSAWQLPNPRGDLLPANMPEAPDTTWLRDAGAQRLMSQLGFSRAAPSPNLGEIVFSRTETRSNLYSIELPQQ